MMSFYNAMIQHVAYVRNAIFWMEHLACQRAKKVDKRERVFYKVDYVPT